ncbi:MAG: D-alanyl-D-alanine carboxypeptidase/D-alanyl-D-alanine-endopeptidase [Candidatus Azobacteroides sp.]|nr:D-alanyl-D-alanine carboxypeptidase/D-alanyl-D-alanine-endopeptidase [Candidatus Azobacteroides sp.]
MKAKNLCLLISFILLTRGFRVSGQTNSAALNAFLQGEQFKHAVISMKAVDLFTGKTLVAYNENCSLIPGSTMKLITTAAALEVMGPSFRYQTPLLYDGSIEGSVLNGNLYIKGTGDPTLGSEFLGEDKESFLKDWYKGIQEAGIRSISGSVVVLDQLFGYEGISRKWLWEDLGNYYAPGIYGISVFDNMYRIYLQSYAQGTDTEILYTEPDMQHIFFTNQIKAGNFDADDYAIFGLPFSCERLLYGTIPANRNFFPVKGDIPDPGLFLARYFVSYLRNQGVEVKGAATTSRISFLFPKEEKELATTFSDDLASIVRVTNVRSNNHFAEHLYRRLKLVENIDIPDYWNAKGLDASALFMCDGSGISPADAISAGFLTDLLIYMNRKDAESTAFYESLPLAGKEGTVASFLKDTPLAEKAHIKSGSISKVQSYAGYVDKGGKRYAFAILVNQFTGKRADMRKQIEKLLVDLF